MESITELIGFAQIIIGIAGTLRIMQCAVAMSGDFDSSGNYKKRMKNAAAFLVVSVVVLDIVKTINQYFSV